MIRLTLDYRCGPILLNPAWIESISPNSDGDGCCIYTLNDDNPNVVFESMDTVLRLCEQWQEKYHGNVHRTGKWIYAKGGDATCSECHITQSSVYDHDNYQNYCGHCGAKMTAIIGWGDHAKEEP